MGPGVDLKASRGSAAVVADVCSASALRLGAAKAWSGSVRYLGHQAASRPGFDGRSVGHGPPRAWAPPALRQSSWWCCTASLSRASPRRWRCGWVDSTSAAKSHLIAMEIQVGSHWIAYWLRGLAEPASLPTGIASLDRTELALRTLAKLSPWLAL